MKAVLVVDVGVGLVLDGGLIKGVAADGARVGANVPTPPNTHERAPVGARAVQNYVIAREDDTAIKRAGWHLRYEASSRSCERIAAVARARLTGKGCVALCGRPRDSHADSVPLLDLEAHEIATFDLLRAFLRAAAAAAVHVSVYGFRNFGSGHDDFSPAFGFY